MENKTKKATYLLIICILFLCSVNACINNASPIIAPTRIQTLTQVIQKTNTKVPTLTPTYTQQIVPTVSEMDIESTILDLIKNNSNCRLPCLWGITPGETTWNSIEPFLLSIADSLEYGNETYMEVNENQLTLLPHYFKYHLGEEGEKLTMMIATNPTGVVELITTDAPLTSESFNITKILQQYGVPQDIIFYGSDENALRTYWYWLILLYPENGFAAYFRGEGEKVDEGMKSCPGVDGPNLYLVPKDEITLESMKSIVNYIQFDNEGILTSVTENPNLSIDSMYKELLDTNGCVVIPLPDY